MCKYVCIKCKLYKSDSTFSMCDKCRKEEDKKDSFRIKNPHCCNCYNEFKPKNPYQLTCSEECESVHQQKLQQIDDRVNNKICDWCGIKFRRAGRENLCTGCKNHKKEKTAKERLEQWKNKKDRKGNAISYEELIRRSEYKRVYGKGAWDHYLKGRKWDKI